jgi:ketosteroid isomerase-like protein
MSRALSHASFAALLTGSLLLGACAHRAGRGADEAAVRGVLAMQRAAWNHGDLEGFMAGYWRSDSLTFYSAGDVSQGWQAAFDRYQRRYRGEGREMGSLDFELRQVDVLDDRHAMVRGAWRLALKSGSPHGLFTLVLRRFPDGWKIVHDHTSAAQ